MYFCCAIEQNDNELLTLEVIHRYVELLDKYFGSVSACLIYSIYWLKTRPLGDTKKADIEKNSKSLTLTLQVCELDIIFNFEKAYFILDELLIGGEMQETSKKNVLKAIAAQDVLQEVSTPDDTYDL